MGQPGAPGTAPSQSSSLTLPVPRPSPVCEGGLIAPGPAQGCDRPGPGCPRSGLRRAAQRGPLATVLTPRTTESRGLCTCRHQGSQSMCRHNLRPPCCLVSSPHPVVTESPGPAVSRTLAEAHPAVDLLCARHSWALSLGETDGPEQCMVDRGMRGLKGWLSGNVTGSRPAGGQQGWLGAGTEEQEGTACRKTQGGPAWQVQECPGYRPTLWSAGREQQSG